MSAKKAMQEASSYSYEEDTAKTVTLEKDGESIWKEKVKAYKPADLAD